jgi:outer membrane murein-binding lipoprotein Lpp
MNRIHCFASIMCVVWLSGCISHAQTPEEFRKAVPTAFSAKVETFEVDRPFSQVATTFQKMGPNCLSKTIKTTSHELSGHRHHLQTHRASHAKKSRVTRAVSP